MIYRVERKENPYVQVDKGFINDPKIGFKEKGILLYFLSKPSDWEFYESEIAKNSTDGLSAVKAAIKNLISAGYITRGNRVRNEKGQLGSYEYIVREVPTTCENPTQGFPTQDFPTLENRTLISNNNSNNNLSNNYDTKSSCPSPAEPDDVKPKAKDKKVFGHGSDEYQLSDYLRKCINKNLPNEEFSEHTLQNWAADIDKLIRIDKKDPDDIAAVIEWCQKDDFWKSNILSGKKLREKYLQLSIKALAGQKR